VTKGVQATVLCEDLQAWVFMRRMLIALGVEGRRIRVLPFPSDGRGSGEQSVRERYPNELRAHRTRAASTKTALVVHLDADTESVSDHHTQLSEALTKAGLAERRPEEAVALLVPKRAIETWIHFFLDKKPVDEETSYPRYRGEEAACGPAAESFAEHVQKKTEPPAAPPSLIRGLTEVRRLRSN
jgi:hypothetical protein